MKSHFKIWLIRFGDALRNARLRIGNWLKVRLRKQIGYVVLDVSGPLPEFVPPRPRWHRYLPAFGIPLARRPLGLTEIHRVLERIANDPRPRGVVLVLDDLDAGWASVESLRGLIARFKQSGKQVAAYCGRDLNPLIYYAACAADRIFAPPSAGWKVLGLRSGAVFLKDALAAWGVEAEVVAVSPYKTAGDQLARSEMSPQQREMLTWILDGHYERLVGAVAEGRGMTVERVRELIDRAPFTAEEAVEAGLLDGVAYLDELPHRLSEKRQDGSQPEPAKLVNLDEVRRALLTPLRRRSGKMIGVIPVRGPIIPGESQRIPLPVPVPIFGNYQTGSDTIAQLFRRVEADERFAGVVLYVDSPGGSALASDLIGREVARVRRKKPVVVYMGDVAASGGYYISAAADWIVCQPLTLTGSIGVVFLKLLTSGLFARFRANREHLQRGAHASIYADDVPLEGGLRAVVEKDVFDTYARFKACVMAGRKMDAGQLDAIAGGRVWLGEQALARGLVDQLGDMQCALDKARELAKLPPDQWTPAAWLFEGRGNRLPPPFEADPERSAWAGRLRRVLRERVWALMPFMLKIE